MSHYNLYQQLGLNPENSPKQQAESIERIISSGTFTNQGGMQELLIAKEILGNPQKKAIYDDRLANSNIPDLTVADLVALAQMKSTASRPHLFNKGNTRTILAVVLVVALLCVGAFVGVKAFGNKSEKKATQLAKEFVKLEKSTPTKDWLEKNAAGSDFYEKLTGEKDDVDEDLASYLRVNGSNYTSVRQRLSIEEPVVSKPIKKDQVRSEIIEPMVAESSKAPASASDLLQYLGNYSQPKSEIADDIENGFKAMEKLGAKVTYIKVTDNKKGSSSKAALIFATYKGDTKLLTATKLA